MSPTDDPKPREDDFVRHGESMSRLARGLLDDPTLAEDVVQHAFVSALENPPHSRRLLPAWLHRVVRNRAIDEGRMESRRRERERAAARQRSETEQDVERQLDVQQRCFDAVRSLREPYRTAIVLRFYEGLPPRKIARRLDVPVKTINSRITRGLAFLRETLDRTEPPSGEGNWRLALVPIATSSPWRALPAARATLEGVAAMNAKHIAIALVTAICLVGVWRGLVWSESETQTTIVADSPEDAETKDGLDREPPPDSDSDTVRQVLDTSQPIAAEHGALTITARWASDGTPASEVGIIVLAKNDPDQARNQMRIVTDSSGRAHLTRVFAGSVSIESDFGGSTSGTVRAGTDNDIRFEIPVGLPVTGRVEDAQGAPVAGAGIWLTSRRADWLGGRVVTTTGLDGTFHLKSVQPLESLGACADGFAPSRLVDLERVDTSSHPVEIRLVLDREGCGVFGRVTGPDGTPIDGAVVAIGRSREITERLLDSTKEERWTPRVLHTDRAGTFSCNSLAPGPIRVTIRADGYAIWSSSKVCAAGDTVSFEAVLARGGRVYGRVTDANGSPVAGARIGVLRAPFTGIAVEHGPWARFDSNPFPRPTTESAADGRYELNWLPNGELHVYASKGSRIWHEEKDAFEGSAEHTLWIDEGASRAWNPSLSLGRMIRGHVAHADGRTMDGAWLVLARPESKDAMPRYTVTDDHGEFRFPLCDDTPYRLEVSGGEENPFRGSLERVYPDAAPVTLTLQSTKPTKPSTGTMRARIDDRGGRLERADALRALVLSEENVFHEVAVEGDHLHAELPAGRHRLHVYSFETPIYISDLFEIEADAEHDLGTIETGRPGSVRVNCVGAKPTDGRAYLVRADGRFGADLTWTGEWFEADNVSPGKYTIQASGTDVFAYRQPIEVAAGALSTFDVEFTTARRVRLSITIDETVQSWKKLHIRVRDADDRTCWELAQPYLAGLRNPYVQSVTLPLGGGTLEARLDGGASCGQEYSIDASTDPGQRISVTVR